MRCTALGCEGRGHAQRCDRGRSRRAGGKVKHRLQGGQSVLARLEDAEVLEIGSWNRVGSAAGRRGSWLSGARRAGTERRKIR